MKLNIPNVNSFRMGISSLKRTSTDGAIDTPEEQELATLFEHIKEQEKAAAVSLMALDNTESDQNSEIGVLETEQIAGDTRMKTLLIFDYETSSPIEFYQAGEKGNERTGIMLEKAVRWNNESIQFREHRHFKVNREMKGMEAVVGDELESGLDYQQIVVGYTFD